MDKQKHRKGVDKMMKDIKKVNDEEYSQYDSCPICGEDWEAHNDVRCFKRNMISYVAETDKTKVKIMAESFDKVLDAPIQMDIGIPIPYSLKIQIGKYLESIISLMKCCPC